MQADGQACEKMETNRARSLSSKSDQLKLGAPIPLGAANLSRKMSGGEIPRANCYICFVLCSL